MKNISALIILLLIILTSMLSAQTDTLITTNGQVISGEIKKMDRGVLTIKTAYSDSDFLIEWKNISAFYSKNKFSISLASGTRLLGTINGVADSMVIVTETISIERKLVDLVAFDEYDESLLSRVSASIGVGLNITKSQNLRQFNMRSSVGYYTKDWRASGSFDAVYSEQDSVDQTKRIDAKISLTYFLLRDWYISASSDFLHNDEQKLELRSTPKFGFGNYIIHSNLVYLAIGLGLSGNFEQYTDPTLESRNSSEIYFNAELNMFDFGDLSLLTNTIAYKNLNESDRVRNDFKFDLKYDFFGTDFYVKIGYSLNYDSHPIEGAAETDYVIQTTLGWDL